MTDCFDWDGWQEEEERRDRGRFIRALIILVFMMATTIVVYQVTRNGADPQPAISTESDSEGAPAGQVPGEGGP